MSKSKSNAFYPHGVNTLLQAGIDPETKLPYKFGSINNSSPLSESMKRQLKILDLQTAVRRYTWYNLPPGISSDLVERILYYRGQGIMFYMEENDKFYFLPYAYYGNINVYGEFDKVTPLPFNGSTATENDKAWIDNLIKKPVYRLEDIDDTIDPREVAIVLTDYTVGNCQQIVPRALLNDELIDLISQIPSICYTNILVNSGIEAIKVLSEDEASEAGQINNRVKMAALNQMPFIPFRGNPETDVISSNTGVMRIEDMLGFMQSMENQRLSYYGLKNGGLFQKKAHMLQDEQEVNDGNIGLIYEDGLIRRQCFCDIINYLWGIGTYCEPSETVTGVDTNGDGYLGDTKDQEGIPGEQPDIQGGA